MATSTSTVCAATATAPDAAGNAASPARGAARAAGFHAMRCLPVSGAVTARLRGGTVGPEGGAMQVGDSSSSPALGSSGATGRLDGCSSLEVLSGARRADGRDVMSKYLLLRIAVATATAAALAAPAGARAATFHVAPDGSDAAGGSAAAPFRTIGQAVVAARVNDTIMVAPGRYREQVSLKTGDSGVSIIGETGSGERPVVDGEGTRQYGFANVGAD